MQRKMSDRSCSISNELRLEGRFCDVIISVDGVEFKAHKLILSCCSIYFRTLFSNWDSADKMVYQIPGISAEMMGLIINYAYTRTVPITEDNVQSLLAAADQFNVMGIVSLCCEFLSSRLCFENCIGICRLTDYYHCPDLRAAACVYILHHFEEVSQVSEEFLDLSAEELAHIIEKDELNVRREEAVFEAVLRWIAHDPQNRRQHIACLLSKVGAAQLWSRAQRLPRGKPSVLALQPPPCLFQVRLALLQPDYFMNNVKAHEYVKDNANCKHLIISALSEIYDLNSYGQSSSVNANPFTRPRLPYAILFAIGGWSGGGATSAIETYDSRTDKWLNIPWEQESPVAYHGSAYLKGHVYVIGGFDGTDYFNIVKRFDPLQKTWQQVAPMHSRRCYVSVTVVDNFIYAMGGFDGYIRLNTAERYDPDTNQWTLITPMHEQRSDASATTLNGKVYICGGFDGDQCLSSAEVFNPTTNQWSLIAPMSSRRSGVGVMAYGNQVYAVGGFDGNSRLQSVEAYNPIANAWHAVPSMLNPRSNFGIEVMDGLLFVVGGFNGFSTTIATECYEEDTNEWYDAHSMGITRSAVSCCVVPGLSNVMEYIARQHYYQHSSSMDILFTSSTRSSPL
ncbi:kelch-like protein 10 isoform X1 [Taeniopygia guttata]|uniref:kelch-like protein 10 isoform X1 n=1 Tax=Taeniopygia guttata TaxID=59729 RepID=UPI003BB891DE